MKKILIFGCIGLAAFYGFKALKKPTETTTTDNNSEMSEIEAVLKQYEGFQVSDKNGYWFIIKNGKLLTAANDERFYAWQKENPNKTLGEPIPLDIWAKYNAEYNGGTY